MRFASSGPVDIAVQGVYFAVVNDVAIGVSAFPRRGSVSGIARMNKGNSGFARCIIEVLEEAAHLRRNKHAFIHNGASTH